MWIKGKRFSDKSTVEFLLELMCSVLVQFGTFNAKVVERNDGLVVVTAPPRPDLKEDTRVEVVLVSPEGNPYLEQGEEKPKTLYFLYHTTNHKPTR